MRNCYTLFAALAVLPASFGQPPTSAVRIPSTVELDRLNLRLGFSITAPLEGPRDGIATIQVMPVYNSSRKDTMALLVVQTRSGAIAVHDAATGRRLWAKRPLPLYPAAVLEAAYDPRGALVVVRDLNLFRFELFPTQADASDTVDPASSLLAVLPGMPTTAPSVVVADPTKKDEGVIVLCFNGSRLSVYGRSQYDMRYRPDTSTINWKVHYDDNSVDFKPGDNKNPSLTMVRSVFGPEYGMNNRPRAPEPFTASLTMIHNLSRPDSFSSIFSSSPSLTVVPNLSALTELSRRDVAEVSIEGTTRRGDQLDFRLTQAPIVLRAAALNRAGQAQYGQATKILLVGSDHRLQLDNVVAAIGLTPDRKIGGDFIRSDLSAPVAFSDNSLYVPTEDGTVYSIEAEFGLVDWSSSLQSAPTSRPAVVAPNLFVTTRSGRLFRLNLEDGTSPKEGSFAHDGSFPGLNARQFLAASDRHVYAMDTTRNLVVLDRRRGTVQGRVDVSGFSTNYLNDTTDRIILGAADGRVISLHDAGSPALKMYRTPPAIPVAAPADAGKPVDKPADAEK